MSGHDGPPPGGGNLVGTAAVSLCRYLVDPLPGQPATWSTRYLVDTVLSVVEP